MLKSILIAGVAIGIAATPAQAQLLGGVTGTVNGALGGTVNGALGSNVNGTLGRVLNGTGNVRGALLGGFILGLAENYGSAIVGSEWRDVVSFVLLIGILLFRPTGLLGESLGRARA